MSGNGTNETTITVIVERDGTVTVQGDMDLDDLLGAGTEVNCGRPIRKMVPLQADSDGPLRVHRIYHGSVVDGPGVRSVLQLQGCPIRCAGCYLQETWDASGGVRMFIDSARKILLDGSEGPRDGITIMGGEPLAQAPALYRLMLGLVPYEIPVLLYTGYTVERIRSRGDWLQRECLRMAAHVIDGPFVRSLAHNAGDYRGSRNQRFLNREEVVGILEGGKIADA